MFFLAWLIEFYNKSSLQSQNSSQHYMGGKLIFKMDKQELPACYKHQSQCLGMVRLINRSDCRYVHQKAPLQAVWLRNSSLPHHFTQLIKWITTKVGITWGPHVVSSCIPQRRVNRADLLMGLTAQYKSGLTAPYLDLSLRKFFRYQKLRPALLPILSLINYNGYYIKPKGLSKWWCRQRETERKQEAVFPASSEDDESLVEFGTLCWGGRLWDDSCTFHGPRPDLWISQD